MSIVDLRIADHVALNQKISYWSGVFKNRLQTTSVSQLVKRLREEMVLLLKESKGEDRASRRGGRLSRRQAESREERHRPGERHRE